MVLKRGFTFFLLKLKVWGVVRHKTQCPHIFIKLTQFEDTDDRKLPLKYYLLRCCSFREMSKTSQTPKIRLRRRILFQDVKPIFVTLIYSYLNVILITIKLELEKRYCQKLFSDWVPIMKYRTHGLCAYRSEDYVPTAPIFGNIS